MAEIEKKTKRYPTDLTDEEWARIEPFVSLSKYRRTIASRRPRPECANSGHS